MTGATAIKVIHNHDNVYVATFYYLFQVNVLPRWHMHGPHIIPTSLEVCEFR